MSPFAGGLLGVSLRQIGAAAGNGNNSAVQYHFGTKDRLVQAVFEYRLPRLRERRDRAGAGGVGGGPQLAPATAFCN